MLSVLCRVCYVKCVMSSVWCQVCDAECVMVSVWCWVCDGECVMASVWWRVCDVECDVKCVMSRVWCRVLCRVCDVECVMSKVCDCLVFGFWRIYFLVNVRLFSSYAISFNATFTAGPTPLHISSTRVYVSDGLLCMHFTFRLHQTIERLRQFIHLFTETNYFIMIKIQPAFAPPRCPLAE